MRRASQIEKESVEIGTVKDLTDVFESIASTQVAKIKNKVELSKEFFDLLWSRYTSIRLDPNSRITARQQIDGRTKKVFVLITGEAGLSGDIDHRLVEAVLENFDHKTTDIIVLGSHGADQLRQRGIPFIRFFQIPESDSYVDVSPVIEAILPYQQVIVYYEEYVSLGVQNIKTIDLLSSLKSMSEAADANADAITSDETIFEPSLDDIADQMEFTMVQLAFSQAIFESTLAQDASRFNAMAVAKKRALELLFDYSMEFHRAKRSESDRRLREVMISLKKKKQHRAGGHR